MDDNRFIKKNLFPDDKPTSKRKQKGRHRKQRTTLFDDHTNFETE